MKLVNNIFWPLSQLACYTWKLWTKYCDHYHSLLVMHVWKPTTRIYLHCCTSSCHNFTFGDGYHSCGTGLDQPADNFWVLNHTTPKSGLAQYICVQTMSSDIFILCSHVIHSSWTHIMAVDSHCGPYVLLVLCITALKKTLIWKWFYFTLHGTVADM